MKRYKSRVFFNKPNVKIRHLDTKFCDDETEAKVYIADMIRDYDIVQYYILDTESNVLVDHYEYMQEE